MKAHLSEWGTPVAPCEPPPSDDWDATKFRGSSASDAPLTSFDGQRLLPAVEEDDLPTEAPQVEVLPECPKIRIEEIVDGTGDVAEKEEEEDPEDKPKHEQLLG